TWRLTSSKTLPRRRRAEPTVPLQRAGHGQDSIWRQGNAGAEGVHAAQDRTLPPRRGIMQVNGMYTAQGQRFAVGGIKDLGYHPLGQDQRRQFAQVARELADQIDV